jgi:hypothetical protein
MSSQPRSSNSRMVSARLSNAGTMMATRNKAVNPSGTCTAKTRATNTSPAQMGSSAPYNTKAVPAMLQSVHATLIARVSLITAAVFFSSVAASSLAILFFIARPTAVMADAATIAKAVLTDTTTICNHSIPTFLFCFVVALIANVVIEVVAYCIRHRRPNQPDLPLPPTTPPADRAPGFGPSPRKQQYPPKGTPQ